MLTLACNSRPQQSPGAAALEFVTPERVRSFYVERMVGSPTPEETDGNPRAIREVIRARLRNLIHEVRRSLTLAQRRYNNYDAHVRPVNKDVQAGDSVFVEGHAQTKYKLGTRAAGPYKVLTRWVGGGTSRRTPRHDQRGGLRRGVVGRSRGVARGGGVRPGCACGPTGGRWGLRASRGV